MADDNDYDTAEFLFDGLSYFTFTNRNPLSFKSPSKLGVPAYRREFSRSEFVFGAVRNGDRMGVPIPTNKLVCDLLCIYHCI